MIESIPYLGDELATTVMAGAKFVDGGGDQQLEAAGDEETIRRPSRQSELLRGRRGSEEFPNFCP